MTGYRGINSPSLPCGATLTWSSHQAYDSVISDVITSASTTASESGARGVSYAHRTLPNPLVIPQIPNTSSQTGHSHEFAKVYAPSLSNFSIGPDAFAAFIDGLNNTVHEAAQAAYTSCSSSRRRGRSNSPAEELRVRIRAYLDASNASTFAPAGLRASIMRGEDMCAVLGVDPAALQNRGKGKECTRDSETFARLCTSII